MTTAQKEKITYKDVLKIVLSITKELFIFSLIFYLLLFILETVFPGFVSNNFDLNWILAGVLILGLVSAFAPPDSKEAKPGKEEKPKVLDYLTSIFLGLLGGVLIFYKIQLGLVARIMVSLIIGILIIALSLVLLLVEDEEVKEKEEEIETFFQYF